MFGEEPVTSNVPTSLSNNVIGNSNQCSTCSVMARATYGKDELNGTQTRINERIERYFDHYVDVVTADITSEVTNRPAAQ